MLYSQSTDTVTQGDPTDRQTGRQTETESDRQFVVSALQPVNRYSHARRPNRQTDRQADRQNQTAVGALQPVSRYSHARRPNRQSDRQTDRDRIRQTVVGALHPVNRYSHARRSSRQTGRQTETESDRQSLVLYSQSTDTVTQGDAADSGGGRWCERARRLQTPAC